jgi:glucose-1-phosphatase
MLFKNIPPPLAIDTIIFDLGNVIVDLDLEATSRELKTMLRSHVSQQELQLLFEQYELGYFSEMAFLQKMKQVCLPTVEESTILTAWNAILLGVNPIRWEMLKVLKAKYQLLVLSNTNETHINWVHKDLRENHQLFDFEGLFDQVYYSHQLHLRKPNKEIYHAVIEASTLEPGRTLFVDDNLDNVKAGAEAGLCVYHHEIGAEIAKVLQYY